MKPRSTLVAVVAFVAMLGVAQPAHAIEFTLFKEHFTMNIIESMVTAYHGDIGPDLRVETDRSGRPTQQLRFADLVNRLNIDLQWRHVRLWTRFDTAVYMDRPAGACGPPATTEYVLRSRYCNKPFYGEKIALEYTSRNVEATLGDFYVSFGRGLVLSIRKLDELGIDTTLRGAKFVYRDGAFAMTLVAGFTNIQNVDQATGRFAADPNDFIGGGRTEYRFADKVNVGVHATGGIQHNNEATVQPVRKDFYMMYGGTIDAPKLTRWLGLYAEGAGQLTSVADVRKNAGAAYAALTGYFGHATLLLESKYYNDYQPWHSSVPSSYVEFAPIAYINPPTAERIVTELQAPIFSVGGIRARLDYRINPSVQLFVSTAYFEDVSQPNLPLRFNDPYGGAEFRWDRGSSHFFPSGGFRYEQDRSTGKLHQQIGHVEWDFTQHLPHGLSVESQGFVYIRKEDIITAVDKNGVTYNPTWTVGTAYAAIKWTPYVVAAFGYEWTTQPSGDRTKNFFNGSLQYNITTASSLRVFVGGNRGGLRCISGICRDFPAFSGARLELVVRL
ncbi:MAG: DUF6029 family protein [Polyangia bacterium]